MRLAICGFKDAGKSTVFNALTGVDLGEDESRKARLQAVSVPDPRLERLRTDYAPKKFSPASVQYEDFPGFGGDQYFGQLRDADALVCVIRGFESPSVMARNNKVDWKRDLADFEMELAIADFILAEKQIVKLKKATRTAGKGQSRDKDRLIILEKLLPILEEGRSAHELNLPPEELETIKDYALLSLKPRIMLINLDDDTEPSTLEIPELPDFMGANRPTQITAAIRARLEAEVGALEEEERNEFLSDFGITELMAHGLLRISYAYLNLISFFTAGDKEVRAWTISRGDTAAQAAGKIHSDFERAFIRAEVTNWADYEELGSVKAAKDAKKWRLEGKGYTVLDGDILEIRHNA
jgi:ribosome-binding ATPase